MAGKLTGKTALVTGSGRGLGRAFALHLASLGANVAVHDLSEASPAVFGEAEGPEEVMAEVRAHSVDAVFVTADLREKGQVADAVAEVEEALGPIEILVNNAGGDIGADEKNKPDPNDAIFISNDDMEAEIGRNLLSTIHTCQVVVPGMIDREAGKIVNVASTAAHHAVPREVMYAVAKAGVRHYTRALARQLRPYGITVNCISPSPTITGRFLATREVNPEMIEGRGGLDRFAQPEDMARVMEFFVTELSGFVSGQTLVVDGGRGTI